MGLGLTLLHLVALHGPEKHMTHHTNEVRRIVAHFHNLMPDQESERSLYPFGRETRIFIAGDQLATGAPITYSVIGDAQWSYSLFDHLCSDRAVEAEFGRLLVNGKHLRAEKYLALWRIAERESLSIEQLIAAGITPVQYLALPTHVCKAKEHASTWYASPFLKGEDETCSTWEVPLDASADHLVLAGQLRGVYWGSEIDSPTFKREIRLRVEQQPKGEQTPVNADLFAEAA